MALQPKSIRGDCLVLVVHADRSELPGVVAEAVEGVLDGDVDAEEGGDPPVPGYVDEAGRFRMLF
jgi:hypothetical protein